MAVFADQIAPFDPRVSMLGLEPGVHKQAPPCIHLLGCPAAQAEHIFGLDTNFQDVFSRVVVGARISLGIGFAAVGMAIMIGAAIGAVAGYVGGRMDNILMRFMDVVLAFPSLLLAIVDRVGPRLQPDQHDACDRHRLDTRVCADRPRVRGRRQARTTTSLPRARSANRRPGSSCGGSCRTR